MYQNVCKVLPLYLQGAGPFYEDQALYIFPPEVIIINFISLFLQADPCTFVWPSRVRRKSCTKEKIFLI